MNVYIACALTHVPRGLFPRYVSFVHSLARAIRGSGASVMYALLDCDSRLVGESFDDRPRRCYVWDRDMVERADVVVAEASFPSTGMGIELQIAAAKGVPIIICFNGDTLRRVSGAHYENPDGSVHPLEIGDGFVSPMALGIPSVARVIGYCSEDDGVSAVVDAVRSIAPFRARLAADTSESGRAIPSDPRESEGGL